MSVSVSVFQIICYASIIVVGCCANLIFLEFLTKHDPGCGDLITLGQFVFISFCSFFLNFDFSSLQLEARRIPLKNYIYMTTLFFIASILNNRAFQYGVSIPVHTVVRSSSLLMSLFLGLTLFRTKATSYTLGQKMGCVMVFIGTVLITITESAAQAARQAQTLTSNPAAIDIDEGAVELPMMDVDAECCNHANKGALVGMWPLPNVVDLLPTYLLGSLHLFDFLSSDHAMGNVLMIVALFISGILGHIQAGVFKQYGNKWQETLFYTHLISLPGFLSYAPALISKLSDFASANPILVQVHGIGTLEVPVLLMLLGNMLTQYVCVVGVFNMLSAGSLTLNLTLTLRKFISLLLSVWYFQHEFTGMHWLGSLCVLGGVVIYNELGKKKAAPSK